MGTKYAIYVCGNAATICGGQQIEEELECWEEELAVSFCNAAAELVSDAAAAGRSVDWDVCCTFRDWNGGRHRQFATYSAGLACTHDERPPKWLTKLIDRAVDVGLKALRQHLANLLIVCECEEGEGG